jgi:hypothetical protein
MPFTHRSVNCRSMFRHDVYGLQYAVGPRRHHHVQLKLSRLHCHRYGGIVADDLERNHRRQFR